MWKLSLFSSCCSSVGVLGIGVACLESFTSTGVAALDVPPPPLVIDVFLSFSKSSDAALVAASSLGLLGISLGLADSTSGARVALTSSLALTLDTDTSDSYFYILVGDGEPVLLGEGESPFFLLSCSALALSIKSCLFKTTSSSFTFPSPLDSLYLMVCTKI